MSDCWAIGISWPGLRPSTRRDRGCALRLPPMELGPRRHYRWPSCAPSGPRAGMIELRVSPLRWRQTSCCMSPLISAYNIAGSPHNSPSARTGRPEAPPVHEVWAGSSTANRYDRPASTTPCRRHRNGLRPPDPKNERCPAGSVLYVHMRKTVDEEITSSILQLSRRPIENPENHGSEESE
jgi:hypothetical protein